MGKAKKKGKNKIILWLLLPLLPVIFMFIFVVGIVVIVANASGGVESGEIDLSDFESTALSEAVLAYEPIIEDYAYHYGVEDYVPVLMAIMMQESGGQGRDPMQSSESHCGEIGCITDPDISILAGVEYFQNTLEASDGDLMVAIQSYNFGTGFASWMEDYEDGYTLDLAIQFSQEQYDREVENGRGDQYSCSIADAEHLGACYGDYLYVQHVMRYLSPEGVDGNTEGKWANPLPIEFNVTSPFRSDHRPDHNGIDLSCNRANIPLLAVDEGEVVESRFSDSYGHVVNVQHDSNLYSFYAHLDERYVRVGEEVEAGEQLGTCGNTGNSRGIHLHLEVRTTLNGGRFDPMLMFYGSGDEEENNEEDHEGEVN